ncbi:MAG: Rrf2 family transcriptional regulator [Bacteroidales bacterium]|nr:Rrf2 family transcriptional regulator [Bacteroidales bacterium]
MKINTKIRYGLRAVIEIACSNEPGGILQKDIAVNQEISLKYLDSIISSLKLKGIISHAKGKGNGFKLTRKPEEITVYDVYTAFEPLVIVECINDERFCDRSKNCVSRDYWIEFKNEYKEMLSRKTIAQIIERNDK